MYCLGCGTREIAGFDADRKVAMSGRSGLASAVRLLLRIALSLSAPVAFAQATQPGPFDGILGTITKSAADALQGGLDKALNKATGGSTNGSGTQSQGSSTAATAPPPPPAGPAQGFSPPLRPDEKRASQATIDDAVKQYHHSCTASNMMKSLHDCECLTRGYRETAERTGRAQIAAAQLGETCPAPKQATYQWVYQDCDDYMQHKRTDHAEFCSCTANRFSSSYVSHPNSNLRKVEALRRESMIACGLSDRTKAIQAPASPPKAQVAGTPSPQPQGTVVNSPVGSMTLPSECFSSNFNGSYFEITNSCKNNYLLLWRMSDAPDRCGGTPVDGHNTGWILRNQIVVAACMQRGVFSPGSCTCPVGSEFTARDLPPVPGGEGFPSGRNGCPVDKKDPRWAKLRPGDVCYR